MSAAKRHRHEFTGLWWHYGPHGPQDVHLHGCFTEDCDEVLVAEGRECGGPEQAHYRYTLNETASVPKKLLDDRDRRHALLRFYEAAH